jgi:transcriptional regulator with XRE-family HTH domain
MKLKDADFSSQIRKEIGRQLRLHRVLAQKSVTDLAATIEMSQSKLSRLELGKLKQSESDIRKIAKALQMSPELTNRLVEKSRDQITRPVVISSAQVGTISQADIFELENQTTHVKECAGILVPGRLQTPKYANAVLSKLPFIQDALENTNENVDDLIVTRIRRHASLFDKRKHFSILIPETVLLCRMTSAIEMTEQYEHLCQSFQLENVDLRIIPRSVVLPVTHVNDFQIFDDVYVTAETLRHTLLLQSPEAVGTYKRLFNSLWSVAISGTKAIDILQNLIEAQRSETD